MMFVTRWHPWRLMSLVWASATAAEPLSCCSAMFCVTESIVECFPPFTAAWGSMFLRPCSEKSALVEVLLQNYWREKFSSVIFFNNAWLTQRKFLSKYFYAENYMLFCAMSFWLHVQGNRFYIVRVTQSKISTYHLLVGTPLYLIKS